MFVAVVLIIGGCAACAAVVGTSVDQAAEDVQQEADKTAISNVEGADTFDLESWQFCLDGRDRLESKP